MYLMVKHEGTRMNPLSFAPFTLVAWYMIQLPTSPMTDWAMFKALIETCVLGLLLVLVLRNQETRWQATLRASEERFSALLKQMEDTMKSDIELRGKIIAEMEQLKKIKFCVYDMDEAQSVAEKVVRLKQK
jgi:flagellar motility protein MotE (MotC chaperone)